MKCRRNGNSPTSWTLSGQNETQSSLKRRRRRLVAKDHLHRPGDRKRGEDDGGAGGVGTPQRGSATQAAAPQGKKGKFSLGEHSIYAETAHCDGSGPTCACQPQKGSKSHSKKLHSYETNDQRKDHRSTSCAPSSAQNCKVPCLTPNLFLMALPAVKTP